MESEASSIAMRSQERPLVSIGMPTYNRADGYLRGALASALSQSYPNLEIVVSDNASTDHTEELVKDFSDSPIRYFRQDLTIPPHENFNFCLEQSRGAFFLMLHDDDLIDPDLVEVCMDAIEGDTSVGLVRTGTRKIDDTGSVVSEHPNGAEGLSTADFFLAWFEGATAIYMSSTLYNTEALKEMGGFRSERNLYLDVVPIMRLAAQRGRVDIPEVKASFRRHEHNHGSSQRALDWAIDGRFLLGLMCDLAPERAEEIRRRGQRHFARKGYRLASNIPSRVARLRTYWSVYRIFDYGYSPARYFLPKTLRRGRRAIARRVKLG